ncbi:hypothetical protein V491_03920 [Pseudogymnoascus sp. VKM F-3775]|nr:hypothetical protein V491_03920 [Pseudogymnoascus sp. VKM F-3775]
MYSGITASASHGERQVPRVGIQRPLEGVAVEEESAVVYKRVYHEKDAGTEARPQHSNACGAGGGGCVGCVSRECRSEAGQHKEVAVPRRSPPRIVPARAEPALNSSGLVGLVGHTAHTCPLLAELEAGD